MTVASFIARSRRRQAQLYTATCTITGPSDDAEATYDPDTDQITPGTGADLYDGPCLIRPTGGISGSERQAGEQQVVVGRYTVKIPVGDDVPSGSLVEIVASKFDPALVGSHLVVIESIVDEWAIARRLLCEEQNRGATDGS